MDVRIMLRVPEAELKRRRHARHGYHTAGVSTLIALFSLHNLLRSSYLSPPLFPRGLLHCDSFLD